MSDITGQRGEAAAAPPATYILAGHARAAAAGSASLNLADDAAVLSALRAGDERAFEEVVGRYHGALLRVAMV